MPLEKIFLQRNPKKWCRKKREKVGLLAYSILMCLVLSLFCRNDKRSLASRHELSHGTAAELSPGLSKVEGQEVVSETDLDEWVDGECVSSA
jgi:hypothetical protein